MFGIRELILIFILFVGVPALIVFILWRLFNRPPNPAKRLAKLEQLHAEGKITLAEYEQQRAVIISSV
jgi:hypothetical protein